MKNSKWWSRVAILVGAFIGGWLLFNDWGNTNPIIPKFGQIVLWVAIVAMIGGVVYAIAQDNKRNRF